MLSGIVTGIIQLAIYDDNNGAANNLLGSVTLSNGQNTTAPPIKINEVNFTTPISVSFTQPTRFWVAFLVPSGNSIAPMYYRDGTACPKAANVLNFPTSYVLSSPPKISFFPLH